MIFCLECFSGFVTKIQLIMQASSEIVERFENPYCPNVSVKLPPKSKVLREIIAKLRLFALIECDTVRKTRRPKVTYASQQKLCHQWHRRSSVAAKHHSNRHETPAIELNTYLQSSLSILAEIWNHTQGTCYQF